MLNDASSVALTLSIVFTADVVKFIVFLELKSPSKISSSLLVHPTNIPIGSVNANKKAIVFLNFINPKPPLY